MSALDKDEFGMTAEDWRWARWEHDRYMLEQRWKALCTIWGRPIVDEDSTRRRTDGAVDYIANRDDDWTVWRALQATIGIVLGRYWTDEAEARWKRRNGDRTGYRGAYYYGLNMAFWDAGSIYGGYTAQCCWLYPGCRVSIFDDSETNL